MTAAAEQHAKRARHTEGKVRKARTPLHRTANWFDAWRRRVTELPPELADELADRMTAHIRAEINRLAPRRGDTE